MLDLRLYNCRYYICFFKQKTAYEMRISDWSSDVCSSDLVEELAQAALRPDEVGQRVAVENLEEGFHRLVDRRGEDTGAIKAAIRLAGAEALDDAEIGLEIGRAHV